MLSEELLIGGCVKYKALWTIRVNARHPLHRILLFSWKSNGSRCVVDLIQYGCWFPAKSFQHVQRQHDGIKCLYTDSRPNF